MSDHDPTAIGPCPEAIPSAPSMTDPEANGKSHKKVEAAAPPAPITEIALSDADKKAMVHLNTIAQGHRSQYTDACVQAQKAREALRSAETLRDELFKVFDAAQNKLGERLGEIAGLQGINLDDPNAGKWKFNFEDMSFRRTD